MAETFDDGELFETIRLRYNGTATEVNDVLSRLSALTNAVGAGGFAWAAGNTYTRVRHPVAGETRTLLLRSQANPAIDPAGSQGAANWRLEPGRVTKLTAALGPYLAIGDVAVHDGKLYELLTAFTALPSGATSTEWRLLSGATSTTDGGTTTPPPAPAPTIAVGGFGPTVFSGTTTNVEQGRTVTLAFSDGQANLTATTDANGAWTVTAGTARTGTFSVSVTNAGGDSAASGPHDVATASSGTTPATPTGARAINPTSSTIALAWTRPDETNIDRYVVFRNGVEVANFAPRAETRAAQPEQSYTFTNLAAGTSYTLSVRGRNAAGTLGDAASVTVSTTAVSATLTAPSKVRAATFSAQPTIIDVYINGTLTGTQQWEIRIGGVVQPLTTQSYNRISGLTAGQGYAVDARKVDGSAVSVRVATTANAVPGTETTGESTAGFP